MEALTDSFLFKVVIFLVIFGLLVAVHEAGHFFAARWFKVKVLRFSIGFGKPIWRRFGQDGTEYVVSWLPLGGYVSMLDSRDDGVMAQDRPYTLDQQSVYKRIVIVAAGPAINLLFAALLYAVVHFSGVPQLLPVIGGANSGSVAAQQGMNSVQQIVAIDGVATQSWQQVNVQLFQRLGDTGSIQVQAQPLDEQVLQQQAETPVEQRQEQPLVVKGPVQTYDLPIDDWLAEDLQRAPIQQLGWSVWRPDVPVSLNRIVPGGAAEQAGLQVGDLITHINNEPVRNYVVFVSKVQSLPGGYVSLRIERGGTIFEQAMRLQSKELEDGRLIGLIGVGVQGLHWPDGLIYTPNLSVAEAMLAGVNEVGRMASLMLNSLQGMLLGKLSVEHISGPVSIAKVAANSAAQGWLALITFLAIMNVTLGVMNLLPIPTLDGGHLMFYLIEMVAGRPVPEAVQKISLRIGMMLILGIMFIAIYNDLARL